MEPVESGPNAKYWRTFASSARGRTIRLGDVGTTTSRKRFGLITGQGVRSLTAMLAALAVDLISIDGRL
jgi:hypothetical protein